MRDIGQVYRINPEVMKLLYDCIDTENECLKETAGFQGRRFRAEGVLEILVHSETIHQLETGVGTSFQSTVRRLV